MPKCDAFYLGRPTLAMIELDCHGNIILFGCIDELNVPFIVHTERKIVYFKKNSMIKISIAWLIINSVKNELFSAECVRRNHIINLYMPRSPFSKNNMSMKLDERSGGTRYRLQDCSGCGIVDDTFYRTMFPRYQYIDCISLPGFPYQISFDHIDELWTMALSNDDPKNPIYLNDRISDDYPNKYITRLE